MLTLQECEALAAAYPEVREHKIEEGDWFYSTGSIFYKREPGCAAQRGLIDTCEGEGVYVQEYTSATWCPRLDQLLALAWAVLGRDPDRWMQMTLECATWADGTTRWGFGQGEAPAAGAGHGEASADKAVHAWLLDRARQRAMGA